MLIDEMTRLGYRAIGAADGEQALTHLATRFDLIVCDIQLTGIDGIEVVATYRAHQPEVNALFVSGAPLDALRDVIPQGTAMLRKPFSTTQLAAALQHLDPSHRSADVAVGEQDCSDGVAESAQVKDLGP
jgi:CheY-like chemotaxis protein